MMMMMMMRMSRIRMLVAKIAMIYNVSESYRRDSRSQLD